MKDKFYYKVAKQVMSTYRDGVIVENLVWNSNGEIELAERRGFTLMNWPPIRYDYIGNTQIMMSMVIPHIKHHFVLGFRDSKKIYDILIDEIQKC
jgi:hypothetical protein